MSVSTLSPARVIGSNASRPTVEQTLLGGSSRLTDLESIRISLERMAVNQQIFLNVDEAAEFTRLSPSAIHRAKDKGLLPYTTGGIDRVIFLRDDLIAYMVKTRTTKNPEAKKLRGRSSKRILALTEGR